MPGALGNCQPIRGHSGKPVRRPDVQGSRGCKIRRGPGGPGAGQDWVQMSTQRRASRTTPAREIDRAGIRLRWFRGCMRRAGISVSAMRTGSPFTGGLTAPLMSIVWLAWAWLCACDERPQAAIEWEATDSLHSDHRYETLAWLDSRSGSPPPGATPATNACRRGPRCGIGVGGPSTKRVTHRSSLRHASLLPVRTSLRPTLPHAPAVRHGGRRAERHDGKSDLYFQHAA